MSSGLIGVHFTLKDLKWFAQGRAASKWHSGHSDPNPVTSSYSPRLILHLISSQEHFDPGGIRRARERNHSFLWVGRETMRSPSVGVCCVGSHGPISLTQFGCRFIVSLHTGRAAFWTITHLSAINGSLECDVLGPNLWVMIIGGKCLWGNSYWDLRVLERLYLLKISQQQFSLQLTVFFESLLLKYSWNLQWFQINLHKMSHSRNLTSMVVFGFVSKFPL